MQTKPIIGVVLAFGVAFALLGGSGIGPTVFGEDPDAETERVIEDIAEEGDANVDEDGEGGLGADIGGDNEPTVTGVIISGGQFAAQLVGAVALLPLTLMRLGFPTYFAVPVGGVAQIIAFIGLVQFVGRSEYL